MCAEAVEPRKRRRKDIFATDEHGKTRKKQKQKHERRKDIFATDEHGKTRKKAEAETRKRSRSKEFLPQRRQVRKERKAMSDAS